METKTKTIESIGAAAIGPVSQSWPNDNKKKDLRNVNKKKTLVPKPLRDAPKARSWSNERNKKSKNIGARDSEQAKSKTQRTDNKAPRSRKTVPAQRVSVKMSMSKGGWTPCCPVRIPCQPVPHLKYGLFPNPRNSIKDSNAIQAPKPMQPRRTSKPNATSPDHTKKKGKKNHNEVFKTVHEIHETRSPSSPMKLSTTQPTHVDIMPEKMAAEGKYM